MHLPLLIMVVILILTSSISTQFTFSDNLFIGGLHPYLVKNFEVDLGNLFTYESSSLNSYSKTIMTDRFIDNILYITNFIGANTLKFNVSILSSNPSLSQVGLFFNVHQSFIASLFILVYYVRYRSVKSVC